MLSNAENVSDSDDNSFQYFIGKVLHFLNRPVDN